MLRDDPHVTARCGDWERLHGACLRGTMIVSQFIDSFVPVALVLKPDRAFVSQESFVMLEDRRRQRA
jgi:hypothetical protein